MYPCDQRKLERTRCVSIPTKDGFSKISALSIDFEHCRLHSSSERLPFSSRSPFPLKQNSWVLDDSETSHSSSHSNIRSDSSHQKTSYLLPQISPGKSSHPQSPSKQPSSAKKLNFRSLSSDSVQPACSSKLSQKSKLSYSTAAGHRFPSSLLSHDSQGLSRPLNDDEFSLSYYVDESRPRGDGCEDDESWMEGGMYESDDGDVLSDLEGEMDESEEAEADEYVSDDSRSTGVDEEGRIFRGHSLTFSKKTSHIAGSFRPLGNSTLPRGQTGMHVHMPTYVCTYQYVYMYIHVYVLVYTYVHICTHVCMYIRTYILYVRICIRTYVHIRTYVRICIHIYTYMHMYIRTCAYTYVYVFCIIPILCSNTYVLRKFDALNRMQNQYLSASCTYVLTYICTYYQGWFVCLNVCIRTE